MLITFLSENAHNLLDYYRQLFFGFALILGF